VSLFGSLKRRGGEENRGRKGFWGEKYTDK